MNVIFHIDGLVQERRNSIANALELRLSCTNPSTCDQCSKKKYEINGTDEIGLVTPTPDLSISLTCQFTSQHNNGSVQKRRNSIANAVELHLFSICLLTKARCFYALIPTQPLPRMLPTSLACFWTRESLCFWSFLTMAGISAIFNNSLSSSEKRWTHWWVSTRKT